MKFIDIPTEQTTSVTDAILAVMAIASVIYLLRISNKDRWKTTLWVCLFGLLAIVSMLGTIVHGLVNVRYASGIPLASVISFTGFASGGLYGGCGV